MRESNLNIISQCCERLSHASEVGATLQWLCRQLAEAFRAKLSAICSYDLQEKRLALRASHGMYVEEIQNFAWEESLTEAAFRRRHLLNVPMTEKSTFDGRHAMPTVARRCHSILVVPLLANDRAVGALTLCRASRQVFPETLVEVCRVLATPIAAFLQNAEMARAQQAPAGSGATGKELGGGDFRTGKPVVPGVCYGRCMRLAGDDALRSVQPAKTADADGQRRLLEQSYATARLALQKVTRDIGELIDEAGSGIFEMHLTLLDDPTLRQRIEKHLGAGFDLNSALALTYKEVQAEFLDIDDAYLRERLQDVEDVLLRLFNAANNLADETAASAAADGASFVLVARELLASQLVASPLKQVCGIVCESGGATSHAAIVARALRIPMLVGITNIHHLVTSNDRLLVDCQSGLCFLNPEKGLLREYQAVLTSSRRLRGTPVDPQAEADDTPSTKDGTAVKLCGNITLFSEMPALHTAGIREIGLYRTEFMFLIRPSMPDEHTQYRVVKRLVDAAGGAPVVVRALDIGGDKPLPYIHWEDEENPSLGLRGFRFLQANPELTRTHLRAILRACTAPQVSLLFPMIADIYDWRSAKAAVEDACRSLEAEGIPFGRPKVGMMLEVPSAVACLDKLLPEVDFVSIGTNDLVQYLFAVDRGNGRVTSWFRQCHPAVLRLLGKVCQALAAYPDKELELCGELAGNHLAVPALLGAGLRKLSMSASAIPKVRNYIRNLDLKECEALYRRACDCDTHDEVHRILDECYRAHTVPGRNPR